MKELQSLPLERKIQITQTRIIEWHQHYNGAVYVSFSGGKDSTVLLHIARQLFPDIKAVFSNTGLEYPEIQKHVIKTGNVDIIRPEMRFDEVICEYGYPLISKEVAEAIHFARRIHSHSVNVERERERTATRRRKELQGNRLYSSESKCKAEELPHQDKHSAKQTDSSQRANVRGSRGCGRAGVVKKSQFNKEKWLPLARDVPVLISHYCCYKMKKSPMHKYSRRNKLHPILGTLTEESRVRKQAWIRHGCNAFDAEHPASQPLSFWTEQDILAYIVKYNLQIADVYGEIISTNGVDEYPAVDVMGNTMCNLKCTGCQRTGCVYCGFGFHLEKGKTRFQSLAETHPRQYEYAIGGGQWADNPHYDPTATEYDGEWKNWNPKKIWIPSQKGLGMGKVFDMANEIYGKDFYRYE